MSDVGGMYIKYNTSTNNSYDYFYLYGSYIGCHGVNMLVIVSITIINILPCSV